MKVCTIEGCGGKEFCRGWCTGHWKRWRRHGSPMAGGTAKNLPVDERLARQSVRDETSGCLNWTGMSVRGYGRIRIGRKAEGTVRFVLAHRLAYEKFVGPIPDGLAVLHTCDNPSCIEPKHLFIGTHAENMADMAAKGRHSDQRGERNPRARLTPQDVTAIRTSQEPPGTLARRYGICTGYVRQLRAGTAWKHLQAGGL